MSRHSTRLTCKIFPHSTIRRYDNGRQPLQILRANGRTVTTIAKHHGPLRVQRVRVRPRRLTWKRAVTWSLGLGLSFFVATTVLGTLLVGLDDTDDVGIVKQQLEENVKGGKLGVEDEDGPELESKGQTIDLGAVKGEEEDLGDDIPPETPEDAWFIPLGFARKMPPTYYSGDDPEWQAFVKFAKDKDGQQRLKHELCGMIGASLKNSKHIENVLGRNIKCRGYWLDIDYPAGPPPSYERYGLEWADDYVALLHRPVHPTVVKRVEKALWPSAVTKSAYATVKELFQLQYDKIRRAMQTENDRDAPSRQQPSHPAVQEKSVEETEATPEPGRRQLSSRSHEKAASESSIVDLLSILPEYPQDDQRIKPGLALFRRKLNRAWTPVVSSPPGSILLQGLIEYRGNDATCTAEVAAVFVVTEMKWHAVFVGIKRIQPNIQRPRGGTKRQAG